LTPAKSARQPPELDRLDRRAAIDRLRPGILVLAVRRRNAEEPAQWRTRGVGVLRQPRFPNALARSVIAVLGLRQT